MRSSPRFAQTIAYAAGAALRSRRASTAGGFCYRYINKVDDGDYHFKVIADITEKDAIVTVSEVYGEEEPTVSTLRADYETERALYPLGIGCPEDCYVYKFNDFSCSNAREMRLYFSKNELDLYGDGTTGYILGTADYNFEVYETVYPCSRT